MRSAGHGRGTPFPFSDKTVALVANSTADVKGAYVEIDAAVPANCNGFVLSAQNHGTNSAWLVDVAIGSAGNEVIIAADIPIEFGRAANIHDLPMVFPLRIPEGARVSARASEILGGTLTINLHFTLFQGNLGPTTYSGVVNESHSGGRGVIITGTGIFEMVASAARNYKAVMFISAADGGTQTSFNGQMSFFVGASSSEQKVLECEYRELATGDTAPHFGYAIHRPIPYLVQIGSRWSTQAGRANKFINSILFFY